MRPPTYNLEEKRDFAREMRKHPTPAEALLWTKLQRRQMGHRFERQGLVYGYIVDFWCPKLRLAIEVDGSIHENETIAACDEMKDRVLASYGVGLLRFTNNQVENEMPYVLRDLVRECDIRSYSNGLKGLGFDLRRARGEGVRDYSSSSRACASLEISLNSSLQSSLARKVNVEIPTEQRLKAEDYLQFAKRLQSLARQMSIPYETPVAERVNEARLRLAEWAAKKKPSLPQNCALPQMDEDKESA